MDSAHLPNSVMVMTARTAPMGSSPATMGRMAAQVARAMLAH
jgi:hypothetical protein